MSNRSFLLLCMLILVATIIAGYAIISLRQPEDPLINSGVTIISPNNN